MASLLHSPVSTIHLLAALVALATGTAVLYLPKATSVHRYLGWTYVGSMSAVLLTAFRIYTLFGRFGIVHWGAVGSTGALLLGVGAGSGAGVATVALCGHGCIGHGPVRHFRRRKHLSAFSGGLLLVEHAWAGYARTAARKLAAVSALSCLGHYLRGSATGSTRGSTYCPPGYLGAF